MRKLLAILFLLSAIAAQAQSGPSIVWLPNPAGENTLSYNIYEHTGTTYVLLGSVLIPAPLTFSLATLNASTTHLIALTSLNVRGESAKSADVLLPVAATSPIGGKIVP